MKKIGITFLSLIYKMFWVFKINKRKIVIVSYYGKGYGDSGKYICEEIFRQNKNYKIVWLLKDMTENVPKEIKKVKYNSIRGFYELATAKIWIDNSRKRPYYTKRKNQFYLQTWHSNLRLKKIEKDAEKDLDQSYIWYCQRDSKMIDAVIVGCGFSYNTMKNSFWYDGTIYKTGIPRCDELFNNSPNVLNKTKKALNIDNKTKIILYAPTFRKNSDLSLCDFNEMIKKLKKSFTDNFVLLVRFHPISKQSILENKYLKNVTKYPDIQELIKICDYMITDYSGCMFDAGIAGKKCILYIPDYKEYLEKERDIYFSFEELPFIKVYSQEELCDSIINFDEEKYKKDLLKFMKKIDSYETGDSSKNVVKIIERVLKNEKI